jgi:hypothetical protein
VSTPHNRPHAVEHFETNEDPTLTGVCTPFEGGDVALGAVTTATDPVLATLSLPLRLK